MSLVVPHRLCHRSVEQLIGHLERLIDFKIGTRRRYVHPVSSWAEVQRECQDLSSHVKSWQNTVGAILTVVVINLVDGNTIDGGSFGRFQLVEVCCPQMRPKRRQFPSKRARDQEKQDARAVKWR